MRIADTQALLDAWDAGHAERREHWALRMLSLAEPSLGAEALQRLSVGERDGRLLDLRSRLFGRELALVDECPQCRAPLDIALDAVELALPAPARSPADCSLRSGAVEIEFRLPDSTDLAAAADCADSAGAMSLLLARCVIEAREAGCSIPAAQLPDHAVEALSARMAALDPQADLTLRLACGECGHGWPVVFDVLPILWRELDAWATRLLREVHSLAVAYGWQEQAILSMSASRRRRYLDLIGA